MMNTVDILFNHYLEEPDKTKLQEKCEELLVSIVENTYEEESLITEEDLLAFYHDAQKAAFYAGFEMAINCFTGSGCIKWVCKMNEKE